MQRTPQERRLAALEVARNRDLDRLASLERRLQRAEEQAGRDRQTPVGASATAFSSGYTTSVIPARSAGSGATRFGTMRLTFLANPTTPTTPRTAIITYQGGGDVPCTHKSGVEVPAGVHVDAYKRPGRDFWEIVSQDCSKVATTAPAAAPAADTVQPAPTPINNNATVTPADSSMFRVLSTQSGQPIMTQSGQMIEMMGEPGGPDQ